MCYRAQFLVGVLVVFTGSLQAADVAAPTDADPALAAAAKALKNSDPEVRCKAVGALEAAGPKALPFLRPLRVALLDDEDERVRRGAACALGLIGPSAAPAVGNLVEMFDDDDETVGMRAACLEALGRIGSPRGVSTLAAALRKKEFTRTAAIALIGVGKEAAPVLRSISTIEDEGIRQEAVRAIAESGSVNLPLAAPVLAQALSDASPGVRGFALDRFAQYQPFAPVPLATWLAFLKDKNEVVRSRATLMIGNLGPRGREAIPELVRLLENDPADSVRWEAAWALGKMRQEAAAAVPALMRVADGRNRGLAHRAIQALGWVGPNAKDAIPVLIKALRSNDSGLQGDGSVALACLGKEALPALLQCMEDDSSQVRMLAATLLGQLGPDAPAAVPALRRALQDKNGEVRSRTVVALMLIGPAAKEAAADLATLIADAQPDPLNLKLLAGNALERIGVEMELLSRLVDLSKSPTPAIRAAAAAGLAGGGAASEAALTELLRDGDPKVRMQADGALKKVQVRKALAPLLVDFNSGQPALRRKAALALARMDRAQVWLVPELTAALRDPSSDVRRQAAECLELVVPNRILGGWGRDLAPSLVAALQDESPDVRRMALALLKQVEPMTALSLSIP